MDRPHLGSHRLKAHSRASPLGCPVGSHKGLLSLGEPSGRLDLAYSDPCRATWQQLKVVVEIGRHPLGIFEITHILDLHLEPLDVSKATLLKLMTSYHCSVRWPSLLLNLSLQWLLPIALSILYPAPSIWPLCHPNSW